MQAFKKIYVEVTNRCNLSCSFCQRTARPPCIMSVSTFRAIIARISPSTGFISPHVLGEPLLHPAFADLLAICEEAAVKVNLTTNGTLIGRHRPILLGSPALRQVNVSLHGLAEIDRREAEHHLEEILDFAAEAGAAGKLFISLRLWNLDGDGAAGLAASWITERLRHVFTVPEPGGGREAARRGVRLAPRVYLSRDQRFTWPQASTQDNGSLGFCRGLRDHLAILADGTVVPCCLDTDGDLALGNILDQPLAAILTDPRARRLQEGFRNQHLVEPLCRRCSYRLRFVKGRGSGSP